MTGELVAIELIKLALAVGPTVVEAIAGADRVVLADRIERARLAARDPIDPSETDAARRRRLARIIRGES